MFPVLTLWHLVFEQRNHTPLKNNCINHYERGGGGGGEVLGFAWFIIKGEFLRFT